MFQTLTTKSTKATKTTKGPGRSIGPPKAASREVRKRKYRPHWCRQGLVFALSYLAGVGVLRTPTNQTACSPVRLRVSVPPCKTVTSVVLRRL